MPAYARGFETAVEEVRRFAAESEPVDLCGLSLGALVGLQVAAARTATVHRLVVCAGFEQLPPGLRRRVGLIATVARFMPRRALHRQLAGDLPEEHRALAREEIAELEPRGLSRLMRGAARARIDPALVIVSTLVLCGEHDTANLPLSRSLAEALPNGSFEVVPGAGHVANLDAPDAFTALVGDFLAG